MADKVKQKLGCLHACTPYFKVNFGQLQSTVSAIAYNKLEKLILATF